MAVSSIHLDHCQIAVDEFYRTGEQPKSSPPAAKYLSIDFDSWPREDQDRLKRMSFVDLERQFDTLNARVRTAIVVQLSRYVVGCTFTEEAS
ncbi:MAG: hypothetical protein DCC68_16255 [Planctomycetota bacterium]|nr:MAG: hypothetical protein DCC68_16255 [Planctomycetota bacterium]